MIFRWYGRMRESRFFELPSRELPFLLCLFFLSLSLEGQQEGVLPPRPDGGCLPFVLRPRFQASQRKFWRELSGFSGCGCYAKKQTCFCLFALFPHEEMQVTVFFMCMFDCRKVIKFTCSSKYWSLCGRYKQIILFNLFQCLLLTYLQFSTLFIVLYTKTEGHCLMLIFTFRILIWFTNDFDATFQVPNYSWPLICATYNTLPWLKEWKKLPILHR